MCGTIDFGSSRNGLDRMPRHFIGFQAGPVSILPLCVVPNALSGMPCGVLKRLLKANGVETVSTVLRPALRRAWVKCHERFRPLLRLWVNPMK